MGESARGRTSVPPGPLGAGVRTLADRNPGLDDQSADLVGTPHPRLAPPGNRGSDGRGRDTRRGTRRPGGLAPGQRRARHVVQFLAVADEHPRLAGPDAGPRPLFPDFGAFHRRGDHFPVGRADELRGDRNDRSAALPRRLHPPHRAGRARRRHEQEQGERSGPARGDARRHPGGTQAAGRRSTPLQHEGTAAPGGAELPGRLRGSGRRRPALHPRPSLLRRTGDAPLVVEVPRDWPPFPHQALERVPLHPHRSRRNRGRRPDGGAAGGRPLDRFAGACLRERSPESAGQLRFRRRRRRPLPIRLERLLRLVRGTGQGAPPLGTGGRTAHRRHARERAERHPAPASSRDSLRDGAPLRPAPAGHGPERTLEWRTARHGSADPFVVSGRNGKPRPGTRRTLRGSSAAGQRGPETPRRHRPASRSAASRVRAGVPPSCRVRRPAAGMPGARRFAGPPHVRLRRGRRRRSAFAGDGDGGRRPGFHRGPGLRSADHPGGGG